MLILYILALSYMGQTNSEKEPTTTRQYSRMSEVSQGLISLLKMGVNPHFLWQTYYNFLWNIKPTDTIIDPEYKTSVLLPGFLCNDGVMKSLWRDIEALNNRNVIFPWIRVASWLYKSIPQIAGEVIEYLEKLINQWIISENSEIEFLGHSAWGIVAEIATIVNTRMRIKKIIRMSSPSGNPAPLVNLPWLGIIPAIRNMRDRKILSTRNESVSHISVIGTHDSFIPPKFQWDARDAQQIYMAGGHLTAIATQKWRKHVLEVLK